MINIETIINMKTPVGLKTLPVTFGNGNNKLTGKIFLPTVKHPVPGALLCHGLGSGHRAMEPSARIIAGYGVAVLVFDFRGHGHSDGILDGDMVTDVLDAWHFLSHLPEVDTERVALIGHSMGAMAAILAARHINPRALIALSCPPDLDSSLTSSDLSTIDTWIKEDISIKEHPRDGAFPWQKGPVALLSRFWMYLTGFRLLVDWRAFFKILTKVQMSTALHELHNCSTLFVHCRGDRLTPYQAMVQLFEQANQPKDLLVARAGFHSAPLLPGNLRNRWTRWAATTLMTN